MNKYPSIESFKHTVKKVRDYCGKNSIAIPTIKFRGTVKLHGTNAGVRFDSEGNITPQSRERVLSLTSDNYGFAAFALCNASVLNMLGELLGIDNGTIYGEWVGSGIQKSVAVSKLPRHFVVFGYENKGHHSSLFDIPETLIETFNSNGIYFINQVPTYEIDVDFNAPEVAAEKITQLTLAVENSCPWGVFRGVEGIGEGIVWSPLGEYEHLTDLRFKSKGVKHQGSDGNKVNVIKADPVKAASIRQLVDEVLLPSWRLEQGISYLRENGFPLLPQSTGEYLKWINKDILKEQEDDILASGFTWKELTPVICQTARNYYLTEINKEFDE